MKHRMLLLLGCLFLTACETVPKIAQTATGRPEIVIDAPLSEVKSAIIDRYANKNYTVEQDTDHMVRMSRPVTNNENLEASLIVGNAYSVNRRVTTFTFVKRSDGVRVVVSSKLVSQMPGGLINDMEDANEGRAFNSIQRELMAIQNDLESK